MFLRRIFGLFVLFGVFFVVAPGFAVKKIFKKISHDQTSKKFPIVYHANYNIGFMGMQKLHPFETEKYRNVVDLLCKKGLKKNQLHKPTKVTDEELRLVHTKRYLNSLYKNEVIARVSEVALLYYIPNWFNFLLQRYLLNPMRLAVGGTNMAVELALKNKKSAINLSGGYHHAKENSGEGFCFFADIPFAVKNIWKKNPNMKVMIVDLDAHRGNGFASIFKDDKRISIFDVYGGINYPQDNYLRKYITYDYPVDFGIKDEDYFAIIGEPLKNAVKKSKPGLIIYNAGTDILDGDPLGRFCVSKEGIVKRDELVFEAGHKHNVPVCMLLSGGYTNESAIVIADSVKNLIDKKYIEAV